MVRIAGVGFGKAGKGKDFFYDPDKNIYLDMSTVNLIMKNNESVPVGRIDFENNIFELSENGMAMYEDNPDVKERILSIKTRGHLSLKFDGKVVDGRSGLRV